MTLIIYTTKRGIGMLMSRSLRKQTKADGTTQEIVLPREIAVHVEIGLEGNSKFHRLSHPMRVGEGSFIVLNPDLDDQINKYYWQFKHLGFLPNGSIKIYMEPPSQLGQPSTIITLAPGRSTSFSYPYKGTFVVGEISWTPVP